MTEQELNEIAEQLDCGFKCFVHKENKSLVVVPDELNYPDMDTESWETEIEEIETNGFSYIEIEKMDSRDSFQVMTEFVETVDDNKIREKLREALERPKPFQNFKFDLDRVRDYQQKWFEFKKLKMIEWVKGQIETANM